jgi:hypothetical protein
VQRLSEATSARDVPESILYFSGSAEGPVETADTAEEASRLIDQQLYKLYDKHSPTWDKKRFWRIEPSQPDAGGLYFLVEQRRLDRADRLGLLHVVPRPAMLTTATRHPSYWFEWKREYSHGDRSIKLVSSAFQPRAEIEIILGDKARDDFSAFADTCDLFAKFISHHSLIAIDREVERSQNEFIWSGRFATPHIGERFFEPRPRADTRGGAGGGWDFQRIRFKSHRPTGAVTLSAEPIRFQERQNPLMQADLALRTKELQLMGWREFKEIDLFATTLVPPEYIQGAETFLAGDEQGARRALYLANHFDLSLPSHEVVLGSLFDKTGRRDQALTVMREAAARGKEEPQTLAYIAHWELSAGLHDAARKHALAALQLQPDNPSAAAVLTDLEQVQRGDTSG